MSNEAQLSISFRINNANLKYNPQAVTFAEDVAGTKGPSPGALTATLAGIDVDLSELALPGLCMIRNLDSANFVTVGLKDSVTHVFYPWMEIRAGKSWPVPLSRYLLQGMGTGTGTADIANATVHIKSDTADVNISFEAFES